MAGVSGVLAAGLAAPLLLAPVLPVGLCSPSTASPCMGMGGLSPLAGGGQWGTGSSWEGVGNKMRLESGK